MEKWEFYHEVEIVCRFLDNNFKKLVDVLFIAVATTFKTGAVFSNRAKSKQLLKLLKRLLQKFLVSYKIKLYRTYL